MKSKIGESLVTPSRFLDWARKALGWKVNTVGATAAYHDVMDLTQLSGCRTRTRT